MFGSLFLGFCLVLAAFIFVSVRLFQIKPDFVLKILKYLALGGFTTVFTVASLVIGYRIHERHTGTLSRSLKSVQQIWGGMAAQESPEFYTQTIQTESLENANGKMQEKKTILKNHAGFQAQKINLDIQSNIRQKGLLKFAGYSFKFSGEFTIRNNSNRAEAYYFDFPLPQNVGNLTAVSVEADGKPFTADTNLANGINWSGLLQPGEAHVFAIKYQAQGTEQFNYSLSRRQTQMGEFMAQIRTDFSRIEVPEKAMVPAEVASDAGQSKYTWKGSQLIAAQDVALKFEIPGNYGAIAAKILLYAPVGLWLFMAMFLLLTISRGENLHLMHFVMILAGFFTMPLLASYLFDMVPMILGLVISLAVSTGIMMYYGILLKRGRRLLSSLGLSAAAFQWVFSLAFFLPEYTGFIVTLAGIASLVLLMRATASTQWEGKW
jgi:hypothetical protein